MCPEKCRPCNKKEIRYDNTPDLWKLCLFVFDASMHRAYRKLRAPRHKTKQTIS